MSRIIQFLNNHSRILMLALFLIALGLRVAFVYVFDDEPKPPDDSWFFLQDAKRLAAGEPDINNLRAYTPPLYRMFMASCFVLFGPHVTVFKLIQAVMGAFMVLLMYWLVRPLSSQLAGLLAATFIAVYPSMLYFGVSLYTEGLFIFLMMLAYIALLASERRGSWRLRCIAGILLGLSALTRDVAIVALGGILVWYLISLRNWSQALRRWSIVAVAAVVVILPWTVRNYFIFEHIVPISTNGGINFYIGNNPEATGGCRWVTPPNSTWDAEAPEGYPEGYYEYEAMKLGYQHGWSFIKAHPGRFVALTLKRVYYFFCPPFHFFNQNDPLVETAAKIVNLVIYLIVFVCSLVMPFVIRRGDFKTLLVFYITVLALFLPHSVIFTNVRFQLPAVVFVMPIAAIYLDRLIRSRMTDGGKIRSEMGKIPT